MRKKIAALMACLLFSLPSLAAEGILGFGFSGGGTRLQDRVEGPEFSLHGGSGVLLLLGAIFPVTGTKPHAFEAQLGAGYLFSTHRDGDHEVSWDRVPLEALYFYRNQRDGYRLGWGLTAHIRNQLRGKGRFSAIHANAEDSLGWMIAAEKFIWRDLYEDGWSVGLRYLEMEYESKDFSTKVDGSTLSFTTSFYF